MKTKKTNRFLALGLVLATAPVALAQQPSSTFWNGTTGNWADLTWSAGVPITGSLAEINTAETVTVAVDTVTDLEQIRVTGSGVLNVDALIGVDGSDFVDNEDPIPDVQASGVHVGTGTLNVNNGGALSLTTGGVFHVGRSGTGVLSLASGGSVSSDKEVNIGREGSGNGTFNQTGGSFTHTSGDFQIGAFGAPASYTISGGTSTVNNLRTTFASSAASTLTLEDGDLTLNGESGVGWVGSADSTVNIQGGTVTTSNRLRLGINGSARTNLVNQTGGFVVVNGRIDLGQEPVGGGEPAVVSNIYQISDGTLDVTDRLMIGFNGKGKGTFNVSDFGFVTLASMTIGVDTANGAKGTMNLTGGNTTITGQALVQNGTVNQSGQSEVTFESGETRIGVGAIGNAEYNISGSEAILNLAGDWILGLSNGAGNSAIFNIDGGTVNSFGRFRIGVGSASSTNTMNQTGGILDVSGRIDIGEGVGPLNTYQISGGSVTASGNILVGAFGGASGNFTVSGTAEVDAPAVVLSETVDGVATVNLNGGTLMTNLIKVGNGLASSQTLNVAGGTIKAKSSVGQMISGNLDANLLGAGVIFDTNGFDVPSSGLMSGSGGLTKTGLGTLTVNGVQAYTGNTAVNEGTLLLTQPYLADNGDVYLTTGAVLDLTYAGGASTDTIGTLYIDGVPQPIATYGGTDSGADTELGTLIVGEGILNATSAGVTIDPEIISINVSGGIATITMTGAPATTYTCRSSEDLVTFGPITTTPTPLTTDGSGNAVFTVDASAAKRFYIVGEE